MKRFILFYIVVIAHLVVSEETKKEIEEGRGKAKYALLTHLTILFAAKVGLYKIILGIALVIASMKAMVLMAWALAAFKYVPDLWPYYNSKSAGHDHRPPDNNFIDTLLNTYTVHFFYVVATKLFVLKIVYGAIFYVLLTKGWHLVVWLLHYLKQKKHDHYVEFDHDHDHGHHHDHHEYYDHQPYSGYGYKKLSYGTIDSYGPAKKHQVYDADGSYSVKM